MKKLFYSLVLFVVAFGAVFPVKAALFLDPPESDADWSCVTLDNGTCPGGTMSPYFVTGNTSQNTNLNRVLTTALLVCSPSPDCINDYDVYFRVEFQLTFDVSGTTNTEHVRIRAGAQARTPSTLYYTEFDCGTSTGGSCSGVAYGIIPSADMPTTSSTYDVRSTLTSHTNGNWPVNYTVSYFSVTFSLLPVDEDCEGNYTEVGETVTYVIDPVIEEPLGPEGVPPDYQIFPMEIGAHYKVQRGGSGWNDGTDARQDLAISWDMETWIPLIPGNADCSAQGEGGDVDTYYITAISETFYIRVNDEEGMFGDNTQVDEEDPVTYTLGQVVIAAPCEDQFMFDLEDDLIGSVTVAGNDEDGVQASNALVVQEWYAITVTDGTWRDEGIAPDRTDMEYQVTYNNGFNLANYADLGADGYGVWCQSTDETTWYIQAASTNLYLRVNNEASTFFANTGELDVSVYHATFTRPLEVCEYDYDLYGAPHRDEVAGNASNGKSFAYVESSEPEPPEIPPLGVDTWSARPLEAGAWYVLDTAEGPWVPDSAVPSAYRFDMAVNDGEGWIPLEDWDVPVCNVALDALGHRRIYFQVPDGPLEWFLRVDDSGSFSNNSGYMAWNLYRAIEVDFEDPEFNDWVDCLGTVDPAQYSIEGSSNYIPVKMDIGTYIRRNLMSGPAESSGQVLSVGGTYVLQINGGPWDDDEDDDVGGSRYDAAISKDNGVTWAAMDGSAPGMECISIDHQDRYVQIRFTVLNGEIWKIRVNDEDGDFANNGGSLSYTLIALIPTTETPVIGSNMPGCDLPAMRPALPIDPQDIGLWLAYVAQWIDYVGVAIRQFFIFCPDHIDALMQTMEKFKTKEPLASVIEGLQMIDDVRIEIASYDWDVEGVSTSLFDIQSAAELEQIISEHIFVQSDGGGGDNPALSPWDGGDIIDVSDFEGGGSFSFSSYYDTCMSAFDGYLPTRVAEGVCFTSAVFRDTGASFWIQISFDVGCIFLMVAMTKKPLQEAIYIMTGVKPWTKSGAESGLEKLLTYMMHRDNEADRGAQELSNRFGGSYIRNPDGTYSRRQ